MKCGDTAHHEGFTCPAKKYQCKACHKFGHFTSQHFQKRQPSQYQARQPKAHQIMADEIHNTLDSYQSDISSSDDSFCLQVKIQWKQDGVQTAPKPTHLIMNIAYQLKQHHTRNQYLRARIDMCADVNIMPISVYRLLYHDGDLKKLAPSWLQIGTYTTDTVKINGTCKIYLVHLDCKKLNEATFYVASNEGSVLLSCDTSLTLGLIHPRPRLNYLPPKVCLIISSPDHPRKTKAQLQIQKHEITEQTTNQQHVSSTTITESKLVTSWDQIMHEFPNVFEGIGKFPGSPYHIHIDPNVTPKQTPCRPIPIHLKEVFQQEISKILQVGVLIPITEATLWINSFVLVESKNSQGQQILRICLDPTNLNKAVTREPYPFCTLEDISQCLWMHAYQLCVTAKKGIGIKNWMRPPPISQPSILR